MVVARKKCFQRRPKCKVVTINDLFEGFDPNKECEIYECVFIVDLLARDIKFYDIGVCVFAWVYVMQFCLTTFV